MSDGWAVDIGTETVAFLLKASEQTHPSCPIRRARKGVALKKNQTSCFYCQNDSLIFYNWGIYGEEFPVGL